MSSSSLANDEVIRRAALETLEALPYRLKHEVEGFLHGVVVGRAQQLEAYADELFQAFEGVRELVRSRHGDRITLYRGEPAQKPDIARRFLSWSPSRTMSLEFAGQEGHELLTAEVDVDDVVAVLAASHNRRYIEYLVRDRKSYHTSGRRPPLLCRVDFDVPWDGFSHELVDGMKRRLERELATVNGRILSMHVDEENGQADAHVLVPANVHTRVDDDMIQLGEFELYSPRPYVRGLEESSVRRRSRQHGETVVRIRLGELRSLIREAHGGYDIRLQQLVADHAQKGVYLRFDTRRFSAALSFTDRNPNGHNNHLGVWGYMLEPGMRVLDPDEFAYGGRHVTVFSVRNSELMRRTEPYTELDLEHDLTRAVDVYGLQAVHDALVKENAYRTMRREEIEEHMATGQLDADLIEYYSEALRELADSPVPFERLEVLARSLRSRGEGRRRYTNFYRSIGCVGIEDPAGIIDTTGRTVVVFEPKQINVIARYVMW